MSKGKQPILCIATGKLFGEKVREGFWREDKEKIFGLIEEEGEYRERAEVEEDESWQQIIPQIVLKVKDRIFIHKIPASGSEERLHDLWPIFLGGHVDERDEGIEEAALREFEEEIEYQGEVVGREFVGLIKINDDNPVNRVHTGLVWVFEGSKAEYEPTEDRGISEGKFVSWQEAEEYKEKMTYWSRLAFDKLREWYSQRRE